MSSVDLERFLRVRDEHDHALSEIRAGGKRSHWMWFVFPQVVGLGFSATAQRYAITSVDEARAYLADPVLGPDYVEMVDAVFEQVVDRGVSVLALFGSPDDVKLVSSLTLFAEVARAGGTSSSGLVCRADAILDAAETQGLPRCAFTEVFVSSG